MDIILVANSPGELSALVKPVAEELGRRGRHRVSLVLTPCQYTSGRELEYISTIKGISRTIPAAGYVDWIIKNRKPDLPFADRGLVLYLGGDLAHAILVAKKLKYPAYAYVQDWIGWVRSYRKFFVPDEQCRKKLGRNKKAAVKMTVTGNLMVDSVADIPHWSPEKDVITFLPGSRQWQIDHMTPLYREIIQLIRVQYPAARFQLVSSPFIPALPIEGVKIISFEEVGNSELVITIPGTNTARLAALGLPMLSLFPLDDPQVIPLEGLPHFLSLVPVLGPWFKRTLINTLDRKIKYFALPNIKAGREIVLELRGAIDPAIVAQKALALLKDRPRRDRMSGELAAALGGPGAAKKIAEELDHA